MTGEADRHLDALTAGIGALRENLGLLADWGSRLATVLDSGGRLLAAGNGGSAAEAQHLTAELVGRFRQDRRPYAAIALHAETSSLTAIVNDYGIEEMYARQVEAHGRAGDVLLLMSTSGRSPNLLSAARRARSCGVLVWSLTGPAPNSLADASDDVLAIHGDTATVQELHLVAVHLLCAAFDRARGGVLSLEEVWV
jgi:D-sedoheptulose 7-phosphate isomerase